MGLVHLKAEFAALIQQISVEVRTGEVKLITQQSEVPPAQMKSRDALPTRFLCLFPFRAPGGF